MTPGLTLGLALSGRPWRGALQRHCRDHVADVALVLVRDAAGIADLEIDVMVVDDDTSWIGVPTLGRLRSLGVVVIGLYDPTESDGHGARHLQRLGVDVVLPSDLPIEELLAAARTAAPARDAHQRFVDLVGDVVGGVDRTQRRLIAVGGPSGAGGTEVAVALTQQWAGVRPLLIDVDEAQPSIARRLGLGIHPHVVTAIDALRGERIDVDGTLGRSLDQCLARAAVAGASAPSFDVIVGLASRDDWELLRADDLVSLVDELAVRWPVVVARIGASLEDLAPRVERYAVSRSVAAEATNVVGVCDASPVGVLRFIDWLVDLAALVDHAPIDVVLNRAPRDPARRHQLIDQLRHIAGDRLRAIVPVPHDKRVERAAWDATTVRRGPFLRAIADLPLDEPWPDNGRPGDRDLVDAS